MGMLDARVKNPQIIGDVAKFAQDDPQIAKAAMSLLSSSGGSGAGRRPRRRARSKLT